MLKKENSMDVFEYLVDDSINPFSNYGDELLDLGTLGPISQGGLVVLTPPDIAEETLDVAAKSDPSNGHMVPISPRGPPARTIISGALNFSVEINALDTHRKKYLYSHQLNRIYVNLETDFPVRFRWDFERAPAPMFVRATVVFSDESQAEKRVERCVQHTHNSANANVNRSIVQNVLHSSREHNTRGVYYCGEHSLSDSWYSVLVQFEGCSAEDTYSHAYQFVCKNSCCTGINRRAIEIIFTLEDHLGHVYGRQMVGARVCACPKRDKLRDEEAAGERPAKRRVAPPARGDSTKRVKLEHDADAIVLPPLPIVGLKTVITGLEVMLSIMEQVSAARRLDQQAADLYQNSISALRSQLDKYKEHPQPPQGEE